MSDPPVLGSRLVFISGGVFSAVGKGIITASIGKILQKHGYSVNVVKIDPYLNIDAGTMNPFEHGETYVTDDGYELDLDFGYYERILNLTVSGRQNITTGQVYYDVINKERAGEFLGETVQIVPHITDEIKNRILLLDKELAPDFLLIEIGGTVGDIESLPFLEAIRQLRFEYWKQTVLFHATYVPYPPHINESKTKPTQRSVMELRRIGLIPDAIFCRSPEKLNEESLQKISLFASVPRSLVFSLPDMASIEEIAPFLELKQNLGSFILSRFQLEKKEITTLTFENAPQLSENCKTLKVILVGKYITISDCYVSVIEALKHAGRQVDTNVNIHFISSESLTSLKEAEETLKKFDGILVPGGFGDRGIDGKIYAIEYARESNKPFLGICLGFQLAIIEYARNVLKLPNANSTEFHEETEHPVICFLPDQTNEADKGGTMRLGKHEIKLSSESELYPYYNNQPIIWERHRHRYEVNPEYHNLLQNNGSLSFTGNSDDGKRMEILELKDSPNFIASQFHPEFKSRAHKPAPVYMYFIKQMIQSATK